MEQIRREVFRLGRARQAGGEALDAAVARARGRHAQLLKSAGQAMVGDSQLAMQDLVIRGEG